MEDYDGSESTELSMLQIVHDPATLASPDLLSEVSDMKQDLIKMSVLLTSEKSEDSLFTDAGQQSEKARNEEVDEPFVIVERVKEDLEKVEEILREGTMDETKRGGAVGKSINIEDEEWVLLSDADVDEYKTITKVQETLFQEVRLKQDTKHSSPSKRDMSGMVSHLSRDLENCLEETPVPVSHPQDVDIVQETFKEVFVTRGSRQSPAQIKKPARKKRKDREFASGSSEDDLERMSRSQSEESLDEILGVSVPVFGSVPVSPKIVETPIGSIKDRVKALQKKVEEESEVESQKFKPQKVATSQSKIYAAEIEKSNKLPPKSPKSPRSQTERLEETMSVRDLMKAFQTGQDPSKSMSGLFEHKAITTATSETLSSVVSSVPQMTVTTQDFQNTFIEENKILEESHRMDTVTVQHNEPMIMDHGIPLDNTSSRQNNASDQTANSNIIFNFEAESPEENLSYNETVDLNTKTSQESGRFDCEELQVTSKMAENESPGLTPERLNYDDIICQDRRLSVEPQISPDRKPSEDFSADIKAELEDSPEYQLFRQTSSEANSHYLTSRDGISLDHEDQEHQTAIDLYSYNTDTVSEFSTGVVQGETLLESEIHEEELEESPDSDKHEALANSPANIIGTRTPHSSTGDSDTHEGFAETSQTTPEIHVLSYATTAEEGYTGTESTTHQPVMVMSNERAESDIGDHIFTVTCPQSRTESPPFDDSQIESPSLSTKTDLPFPDDSKVDLPFTSTKTESLSPDDSKFSSPFTTTETELPSPGDSKIDSSFLTFKTELPSSDDTKFGSPFTSTKIELPSPDDSKFSSPFTTTETELPSPGDSKIDSSFLTFKTELPSTDDTKFGSPFTSTNTELPSPDNSKFSSPFTTTETELQSPNNFNVDLPFPSTKTELPSPDDSKVIIQDTIQDMQYSHMESVKSASVGSESKKPIDSDVIINSDDMLQYSLHSEEAPHRPSNLDSLLPKTLSDSKTICQTDSLETSPIKEDWSSHKSPDSIEPSPTKESPCQDSLEGSPTGQWPDLQETGQLSYIERVFSTSKTLISNSREHVEQEIIFKEDTYEESESLQKIETQQTPDMQCLPKTSDSEEMRDREEVEHFETLQRQFTPEEEMFKMAAKIKTFDEMEKESKKKRVKFNFDIDCSSRQPIEEFLSPHNSPPDYNTVLTKESQEQQLENLTESSSPGPVLPLCSSLSDDDYDRANLGESPHNISEEASQILETMDKSEEDKSHLGTTDLQCKDISFVQTHIEDKEEDYEQVHSEYHSMVIGEAYAIDRTEQDDLVTSKLQNNLDTKTDSDDDTKSPSESKTSKDIFESISTVGIECTTTVAIKVQDETQPGACVYEEDHEEIPEEILASIQGDLVPWSAVVDDDEAFHAKIEAEEQKILALCTDRQSHGTTPDTTPGRTPTEEGTPNPFLFQEGKLFEMTRGGAIDMTKRTMDDEEERAVFFPINENPTEEDTFEEVTFNTSESVAVASAEQLSDGLLQRDSNTDESDSKSDSDTETEAVRNCFGQSEYQSEQESPTENHLHYENTLIPNIDTATSTVTRTVYSEQDMESSDSSVEDEQHSVVEMPITTLESVVSASVSEQFQSSSSFSTPCKDIVTEDITPKPKLDVKAASFDQILEQGDSIEQNQRPKSEADIDNSEWSMYVAEDSFPQPKTLSSQLPFSQRHDGDNEPSNQPEPPECSQELDLLPKTDCDKIKGGRTSFDLEVESSLKIVRPPSVGEDVFETRPNWEDSVETQMQRMSNSSTPEQCKADWLDDSDRKEETLAIIADLLGFSWTELAKELEFNEDKIQQVRAENPNSLQEQSHALLQRWVEREGKHATEDTLIERLTKINRMDIVHLIEIQMNKSVKEQTSRTYAEIERTLDHSEALSSVQEDIDSVRVVRRVETSQRHPPAVSEEDLSVASLLDIPSWAETMGNAHSESIHGDLMEELEINQDSFSNQWPSQELKKESMSQAAEGYDVPDIPPQSVTEEQYTDAQGNLVVKKVTRKVIRRCVSSDGVEREQVRVEGSEQQPVIVEQGNGYSKVIRRTVLKSEGHQTEVTFHERDGMSSLKEGSAEGQEVRQVVQTTMVHGERLEKHEGDAFLATDLPSARDDFTQDEDAEV